MNRIKELREKKGIGQKALAADLRVTQPTISDWEAGRKVPSSKSASRLADYFGVSMDYLLCRENPVKETATLNARDQRDIAKSMEELTERLMSEEGLMFNGNPITPEQKQSLLNAMQLGVEAAKLRNKEKYTPKKYRKPKE